MSEFVFSGLPNLMYLNLSNNGIESLEGFSLVTVSYTHLYLRRRLRNREEIRPDPCPDVRAEYLFDHSFQRAFKVRHSDASVHDESFNLRKYRGMGGVYLVDTVYSAGGYDSYGRTVLFHDP